MNLQELGNRELVTEFATKVRLGLWSADEHFAEILRRLSLVPRCPHCHQELEAHRGLCQACATKGIRVAR